MIAVGQPCDAGVIRCTRGAAPCRPSSRPWVIAAASLGSGMAFLDSTVMNVALPAVQTDLAVSARDAQWVYGAFALVLAAFLLIGGSLGDRYGRRRVFVVGAAIAAAASVWRSPSKFPKRNTARGTGFLTPPVITSRPSYCCAEGSPMFSEIILMMRMIPSFANFGEFTTGEVRRTKLLDSLGLTRSWASRE
jgi:MFS family permease